MRRRSLDNTMQEAQTCSVCLDRFDRDFKPPKLLPCGHNFCEGCLFSLCLHREYYLLDTVKCPKCSSTFDAKYAMNAPTNLDLCDVLEQTQSTQNITVIHVNGPKQKKSSNISKSQSTLTSMSLNNTTSSGSLSSVGFVVDLQDSCHFCFDCRRYVIEKDRSVLCRFCLKCNANAKRVRLTCLECCVNRHNGHLLKPIEDLEANQQHLINDLHILEAQCQRFAQIFYKISTKENSDILALKQTEKLIISELESCIQSAYARIHSEQLLHPNIVSEIRQRPFLLLARLQRLANLLEQANDNQINTDENELDCFLELRQALQSLCTLTSVYVHPIQSNDEEEFAFEEIRQFIVILCSNESAVGTRSDILKSCVRSINSVLYGLNRPEFLLLFADAYLNCFITLNLLNPRRFGCTNLLREQIWKLIQTAYSELLRLTGMQWSSTNENRIQVVADFARLCSLFGDVCDSSSVTLCMIESARARALGEQDSSGCLSALQSQLQQIDEHLQEIRRVQKLAKICVRSRSKKRKHANARWLGCFMPKIK